MLIDLTAEGGAEFSVNIDNVKTIWTVKDSGLTKLMFDKDFFCYCKETPEEIKELINK